MNVTLYPSLLRGAVVPPPSKSHVHRLLLASVLCEKGQTAIFCPGENEDIRATLRCLQAFHARIHPDESGKWLLAEGGLRPSGEILLDCGESGSTLRFLLTLCGALADNCTVIVKGSGRLPQRPNGPLLDAMRKNGARIQIDPAAEKKGDQLPLILSGGMQPGEYALPGNISSQYFTGLLFALPLLPGESMLRFTSPLESMPYVDFTLSVLRQFGVGAEKMKDGWRIPGNQKYCSPGKAIAEGDWSAAAFWEAANFLGSSISIEGMNGASVQGDKRYGQLLAQVGGEIDVTDTPDLMPPLAIAAAATPSETRITGAARLRLKESDRLLAMAQMIRALGGQASETEDGLIIRGGNLKGGVIDGMNDHRVIMSAAIAATVCRESVTIRGAEAVKKSYPQCFEDFARLGGKMDVWEQHG